MLLFATPRAQGGAMLEDIPDPGAMAVAIALEAIMEGVAQQ